MRDSKKYKSIFYDDLFSSNPFFTVEHGCYTLSEMLDIKEIWININNVGYKFKLEYD